MYFLILHEASHNAKFEGIDKENGNSFFQIPVKSTQIQNSLGKLKKFFFLSETLSELCLFSRT